MKKLTVMIILLVTALSQTSFAQDTSKVQTSSLLKGYYDIKNSLISGDAKLTATSANGFIGVLNGIDYKIISEGNVNALLKDATAISESKDINEQRKIFENLSLNMTELAKAVDLSDESIYQMYCPMKGAYWLSSEKEIKNPYFGNSMLTCGKVVDTIDK